MGPPSSLAKQNWGQLSTHKWILQEAHRAIAASSALKGRIFPSADDVLQNEGVDFSQHGPGPDGKGNSRYSEHYYNPYLKEGDAPASVERWFEILARGHVSEDFRIQSNPAKAAAYSAHYLSDMFVPYHLVGASYQTILEEYIKQGAMESREVILKPAIFGRLDLCYGCLQEPDYDFKKEVENYLFNEAGPEMNWFDPWLQNGFTGLSTSHALWEATSYIHHYKLLKPEYHSLWKNSETTSFDAPWEEQARAAGRFTREIAQWVRSHLDTYFDTAMVLSATIGVYTMWRASVSALRPSVEVTVDPSGKSLVTAVVANLAEEQAREIRARIKVLGPDGKLAGAVGEVKTLGNAPAGGSVRSGAPWTVDIPEGGVVRIEAVGCYSVTPDLQYAVAEQKAAVTPVRYSGTAAWRERKTLFTPPELKMPPKRVYSTDNRRTVIDLYPPGPDGVGLLVMTEWVNKDIRFKTGPLEHPEKPAPFGDLRDWFPDVLEYPTPLKREFRGGYDINRRTFSVDYEGGIITGTVSDTVLQGSYVWSSEYMNWEREIETRVTFTLQREARKKR